MMIILSQNDQDLKQSASKPKVVYDEVIPPCRQNRVSLKKKQLTAQQNQNISHLHSIKLKLVLQLKDS